MSINTRLYMDPECLASYQYFNKQGNSSCLNTVTKQQHICKRGKSPDGIKWYLDYLQDSLRMGRLKNEVVTGPALDGAIGDLAMMKFDLNNYFLTEFVRSLGFPRSVEDMICFVLGSFETVRKYLKPYPDGGAPATAWKSIKFGMYSISAGQCCDAIETTVFGVAKDATLKVAAKAGKGPDGVAEYSVVKEALDEVRNLFKTDHAAVVAEAQEAERAKRKALETEQALERKKQKQDEPQAADANPEGEGKPEEPEEVQQMIQTRRDLYMSKFKDVPEERRDDTTPISIMLTCLELETAHFWRACAEKKPFRFGSNCGAPRIRFGQNQAV